MKFYSIQSAPDNEWFINIQKYLYLQQVLIIGNALAFQFSSVTQIFIENLIFILSQVSQLIIDLKIN